MVMFLQDFSHLLPYQFVDFMILTVVAGGFFIILLPIGQIILLIYYLEDSYIGENEYGKNPKE